MDRIHVFYFCLLCSVQFACGQDCRNECATQMLVEEDEIVCNETCKVTKCQQGCKLWTQSLDSSCQNVCEKYDSFERRILYCIMGCNLAINSYLNKLKEELGIPGAPYLVAESRTHGSIKLQWPLSTFTNITYLVQWRYESLFSKDWEYYEPHSPLTTNQVTVAKLHPYTQYRFRIAWILLPNSKPLLSDESVVISTLPFGVPSASPTITSLTVVGPTQISVSWKPPMFPNGPILAYVLYLKDHSTELSLIKDSSANHPEELYTMFNHLTPGTNYTLSIAARNNVGEGPSDSRDISLHYKTDTTASSHSPPRPNLVFSTPENVLMQGLNILDEPFLIYRTLDDLSKIKGVSVHVKQEVVFLTDSHGNITRVPIENTKKVIEPLSVIYSTLGKPSLLSVDWLNNQLYIGEETQIIRCSITGDNCEVVIAGFDQMPSNIQVDPCNGYLYWVLNKPINGGLYRIDLEKVGSRVLAHQQAQLIVRDPSLKAFAIDYKNFRLLLPKADKNTMVSIALDGSDEVDIRSNSQSPQFTNIQSLASFDGLFYWTTGDKVCGEEYHSMENKFYHNAYVLNEGPFFDVSIFHNDVQPHPVPHNTVEDVQAIFLEDLAKIVWTRPRLLGGLGRGSWQNWLYEVYLYDIKSKLTIFGTNISETSYTLRDLSPNTVYSIKVRAYSLGGKGSWSTEFIGKTLKSKQPGQEDPYILWSANEGLLRSDLVGDKVEPIFHYQNLDHATITGIAWQGKQLFLNTNNSHVYSYSHHSYFHLANITNAVTIAIDWIAPKLYWASPMQQMISRSNLDGSQTEPLPILTLAHQLAIDSPASRLYWATSHTVECSYLNGDGHHIYYQTGFFSGKYVMGLTLNFEDGEIYWMVRNYEGSILHKAPLIQYLESVSIQDSIVIVGHLPENEVRGPLLHFSDRLFWVHGHLSALVSDLNGRNVASLKGLGLGGLKCLTVIDPSLQPYPEGFNELTINVIPEPVVDAKIDGVWNNFTIVWPSVINVNYGQVFYELQIENKNTIILNQTFYHYPEILPPYTPLVIALKAFTYWGSSRQVIFQLATPMSTPSQPLNPRAFVTYHRSHHLQSIDLELEFRWDPPQNINGILKGYKLSCWVILDEVTFKICDHVNLPPEKTSYIPNQQLPNTTFFFQVQAYTEKGHGPLSNLASIDAFRENPITKIIVGKKDSIVLLDVDSKKETVLTTKASHPLAVAYLALEKTVFWIEDSGALMSSHFNGSNLKLVKNLNISPGMIPSLAINWLSRILYWTENSLGINQGSSLWSLDLAQPKAFPTLIYIDSDLIGSVQINPFSGNLFFTSLHKHGTHAELMTCGNKGQNAKLFFTNYQKSSKEHSQHSKKCNCPHQQAIGRSIVLDRTVPLEPKILWVDLRLKNVWSSDLEACHCSLALNTTKLEGSILAGLPSSKISLDRGNLYWLNSSRDVLYKPTTFSSSYSFQKKSLRKLFEDTHITCISAFGKHLQPYPDTACLAPLSYSRAPKIVDQTSSSLTLRLDLAERASYCTQIPTASTLYTIYYNKVANSNCTTKLEACSKLETYNSTVVLDGLSPFTNYTVRVAASNFYFSELNIRTGPKIYHMTKEGAPSKPRNITAINVTPERIDIHWEPSAVSNGENIYYEVRWSSSGNVKQVQAAVYDQYSEKFDKENVMSLANVVPDSVLSIVVRAYSSDGTLHTDSDIVEVKSLELPNNISLWEAGPTHLAISWMSPSYDLIAHHTVEFKMYGDPQWNLLKEEATQKNLQYNFSLPNLVPMAKYVFRLLLTYQPKMAVYPWPTNREFVFLTLADKPGSPGVPVVREIGNQIYQVVWQEANNNGGETLFYQLQYKILEDSENIEWITIHNITENHWIVTGIQDNVNYQFRVQAINELGESSFALSNEPFFLPHMEGALIEPNNSQLKIFVAASLGCLLFIILFLGVIYYFVNKKRELEKKSVQSTDQYLPPPDLELATLRELPFHGNFIHQNNALYAIGDIPTDEELAALPQICRDQIVLTKFLGSGAFGEVFEGLAHDLDDLPSKVAIKTLRKGATGHEKTEFLKEAKLMSHFNHEHILKLLGICLDNNPNFLILELMEGGDLLSFLRSQRPSVYTSTPLRLDDLLSICVDVAKGCQYLEEMHFVHRDLAARNCLVSSLDPATRVVKIGDFGLARDIYKNDYYRKEGEGLLPVRWMAPESLIDGVFTSQSDIWSFGVLLWEVMTLGHQPYPARTNKEVLEYVRAGGRPDIPENCPEELHQLMMKCWNYFQADRPTFLFCLNFLRDLKTKYGQMQISVHNQNYMARSNKKDRPRNDDTLSTASLSTNEEEWSTIGETQVARGQQRANEPSRYLELLGDQEQMQDVDGYEMPLPLMPSHLKSKSLDVNNEGDIQYADFTRSASQGSLQSCLPSTSSSSNVEPITPPPSYTQVVSTPEVDNNRNVLNGYISMHSSLPIIASALLKPNSDSGLLLASQPPSEESLSDQKWPLCNGDSDNISYLSAISGIEIPYFPNTSLC